MTTREKIQDNVQELFGPNEQGSLRFFGVEMTDEKIQALFDEVPYFADSVIEEAPKEMSPFILYKSWCDNASVNIQRVCGTSHPKYIGMTWRELLSKGKRMPDNLNRFVDDPYYYLRDYEKFFIDIFFYNGKGYVEDGIHRVCIARFFLYSYDRDFSCSSPFLSCSSPFLHGVRLREVQSDLRMEALFSEIQSLLPVWCRAYPVSKEVSRDDGYGWAVYRFHNSIQLKNTKTKKEREFSADEAEQILLPALRHPFRRFLKEYRELIA